MLSKCMSYLVPIVMMFLIIGILLQYYISIKLQPEELLCYKGKLLIRLDSEQSVYTRLKSIGCDDSEGMLIIEEQS